MIFSENTWLIVWTSNPIEFLEFSPVRPRISRRPLFHDSGSESYVYDDAVLFRFEIPEMGRGGGEYPRAD